MACIDHALIYQACKLVTGANTHAINACLHKYETTKNAQTRARYERTLRQFVAESHRLAAIQAEAEFFRRQSNELKHISDLLDQEID